MRLAVLAAHAAALLAAPDLVVRQGKHIDVVGADADTVATLSRHADEVAARFVAIFGAFPGERAAVLLEVDAPVETWKQHGATWKTAGRADADELTVDVWRFELAKTLLARQVDGRACPALRREGKVYASLLPDWLDEAVAGLHRTEDGRKEDRELMRETVGAVGPLEELFRTLHPLAGVRVDADVVVVVGWFTSQSRSLGEFLVDRYGDAGLLLVVETALRGRDVKTALPGLAKIRKERLEPGEKPVRTLADLRAAWIAWVEAG